MAREGQKCRVTRSRGLQGAEALRGRSGCAGLGGAAGAAGAVCPVNQSPGESERQGKDRGTVGNLGRLPGGGGLELGLDGGGGRRLPGDPGFPATPPLGPDAAGTRLWSFCPALSSPVLTVSL